MGDLAILGLRPREEEIYRFLASRPGCTLTELAGAFTTRNELPAILASLECKGLVTRTDEDPPRIVPASPDVALGALIADRENELRNVRELASSLLERFREVHRSGPPRLVEAINGADVVRQRAVQLQRHARDQVRILDQTPYAFDPAHNREVVCRRVCDSRRQPGTSGEQARIAAAVPTRLLLCDDLFALLPLPGPSQPTSALLVNPSPLLEALAALFEVTWRRARPLRNSGAGAGQVADERPSAEDLRLLRLLSTGAKDEALGRRLGLSARTVHRRIQALQSQLGVTTRLQLGIEAERRGWIGHP